MRTLIVDDEPIARRTAQLVLSRAPEIEIVGMCTGVDAAVHIAQRRPDLLVLDVQMPGCDGFDVLAQVGPAAVRAIVFVTAYDQYAVRAFDVHAVDYVLKPYDDDRLLAAVARARAQLASQDRLASVLTSAQRFVRRFFVRSGDRTLVIDAGDVDLLEAADDHVELHVRGDVHQIRERLAELEQRLDPERFVRIHRSAIVNLDRVREIQPLIRGDAIVVIDGGAAVRCSRSRRRELERRLAGSPRHADHSPSRR